MTDRVTRRIVPIKLVQGWAMRRASPTRPNWYRNKQVLQLHRASGFTRFSRHWVRQFIWTKRAEPRQRQGEMNAPDWTVTWESEQMRHSGRDSSTCAGSWGTSWSYFTSAIWKKNERFSIKGRMEIFKSRIQQTQKYFSILKFWHWIWFDRK